MTRANWLRPRSPSTRMISVPHVPSILASRRSNRALANWKVGPVNWKAAPANWKPSQPNSKGAPRKLDQQQKQTDGTVAKVNDSATKANAGVDNLGHRVSDLDDYETKGSTTVYFAVKSAKLTPEACKELDSLIDQMKSEKGYMIEVAGFADTTGNPDKNVELSERRAAAVVQYLQLKDVPLRRILAPAGLGTTHNVADNTTPQGRKQNRRVEVRVLVNRGITG